MERRLVSKAQSGDICVLLVPTYSQSPVIRIQLADLQRQFGGEIVAPLHVTCQRFRAQDAQLEALKPRLAALAKSSQPVHIKGSRLEPFYSTFRAQEILKCHIDPSDTLDDFANAVRHEVEAVGIEPHYDFTPGLITMLEGITISHLNVFDFRRKLFIGQRLLLTRIKSPGHYKTLFSVGFSGVDEAELEVRDIV